MMYKRGLPILSVSLLALIGGCGESVDLKPTDPTNSGNSSNGTAEGGGSGANTGASGGDDGATDTGGNGSGGVNGGVTGPDSRDTPAFGEPGFDPSVDPGVHPTFLDEAFFQQGEDYVYTPSKAGDHDLGDSIYAIDFDVTGQDDLRTVLSAHLSSLGSAKGLALYLVNGTELRDEDLDFLQVLHSESDGLALDNLDTLHIYNLRSLRGGVQSTTEIVYGNPYPYLYYNGWQGPDSEIAKGDGGWVKHLVLDDLEEIKAGTFCDTRFESVSLKAVTVVREMGFGFRPRADMPDLYLPSAELIETHAFRRNQFLLRVHLPKVTVIEDFAFDDNSRLEYFSAASLESIGRNGLNDTHELISVHLPKLEYVGINCFDLQYRLTTLRLPSVTELRDNALEGFEILKFAYLPSMQDLNSRSMINCFELEAVYLGQQPPEQGTNVFSNTSDQLTIYYSGDAPGWQNWTPSGNETAPLVKK